MQPEFNEYATLKLVAVRRPAAAFADDARIDAQWRDLNYHARPDLAGAVAEHAALEGVMAEVGADIVALDDVPGLGLDSLYVRDSLIVTPAGLVRARMGKAQRQAEPERNAELLAARGIAVVGAIEAPGKVEGGDLVWLDRHTLLAGLGYRTNRDGVDQLRRLVGPEVAVEAFDLPHYRGRSDVFHLMSVLSPLDADLAAVHLPLMPARLVEFLEARAVGFVEVPETEFPTMGCNVLTVAPRRVAMVDGNPETERRLRAAGCTVHVLKADEMSRKGEGGPTCLTRPLIRAG